MPRQDDPGVEEYEAEVARRNKATEAQKKARAIAEKLPWPINQTAKKIIDITKGIEGTKKSKWDVD